MICSKIPTPDLALRFLYPARRVPLQESGSAQGFLLFKGSFFFPVTAASSGLILIKLLLFSTILNIKRSPLHTKSHKVCEKCLAHVLSCVGKVLVHCARGISRSATLVLAYLMLREGLTLVEALEAVRRHRNILPNAGFLNQLRQLDASLARQRNKGQIALPEK